MEFIELQSSMCDYCNKIETCEIRYACEGGEIQGCVDFEENGIDYETYDDYDEWYKWVAEQEKLRTK